MAVLATLAFGAASDAPWVNRHLLRELLARTPVALGSQPTLDAARLRDCLRRARHLDWLAGSLDQQMIMIEDTTSRVAYYRRLENLPQLPRPDVTESQMRAQYEYGIVQLAEFQKLLDRDTKAYRAQLAVFNDGLKAYEQDCAGSFSKDDLEAAKARLKMK